MRNITSTFVLFLLSAPLAAQQVEVRRPASAVELAPATLAELARVEVTPPAAWRHDELPRPRIAAQRAGGTSVVAEFVTAAAAAAPPPVTRGFQASFDPLPNATLHYDPPDASGAVSPRHVVGAFNNSLTVHDRDGNLLSLVSIPQFWHDPAWPDTVAYDPRVMYDAKYDHFVLAMLTDSGATNGVVLLAVSETGDPTGTWRRSRVSVTNSSTPYGDFTRMAMTADSIVITMNEFVGTVPSGVDVLMVPRSRPVIDSLDSFQSIHVSNAFEFTPVNTADATLRFLTQDDTTILQYVLTLTPARIDLTNRYLPPAGFLTGFGLCNQLGTTTLIECDDSLLHYAFIRDGVLWVVHTANDNASGFIVIWKIVGASAKGFVIANAATDYGYPSLAVNRLGAALAGYSAFSDSIYPSAAYTYIDPAGNLSTSVTLKSGEDWYSGQRWGDYSATLVDPLDDTSFWTLQTYATPPRGGTDHRTWGTWWSYVQLRGPRVRAVRHP